MRTIVLRDAQTMDHAKTIAQASFALPKVVVVAAIASPPSLLVATSEDSGLDAGKLVDHLERLSIHDANHAIAVLSVIGLWHEAYADAFHFVRASASALQHGAFGFDGDGEHTGIALFHKA